MGKIRISTLGSEDEAVAKAKAKVRREEKKKREAAKAAPVVPEVPTTPETPVVPETDSSKSPKLPRSPKLPSRSKLYQQALTTFDRQKLYSAPVAIELIKKINLTKFDGTFEAHLNLTRESLPAGRQGLSGSVVLPHGTGKQIRVAIVSDELLDKLNSGKIDFDILISHPSMMIKLVKFAKLLGPKGLMPNPKNGTISEKPEETAKKFSEGQTQYKTEADFPLIHTVLGKVSFKTEDLEENLAALIKAIGPEKIKSIFLKSTMSPSVRVKI